MPSAAAVLADWVADVVKVERPQGDPLRAVTASGLVAEADVFITNLLPNACEKLRIRPGDLRAVNLRLVYARGHAQCQLGPEAGAGGYDAVSFFRRGGRHPPLDDLTGR